MSTNEWEHGTIALPSADVPPLKKTLRDWANALHDEVRAEAIRLHKEVAKGARSPELYRRRLREAQDAERQAERAREAAYIPGYGYSRTTAVSSQRSERARFVSGLAHDVLTRMLWAAEAGGKAPHRPTLADVNGIAARKTNRDQRFEVYTHRGEWEATITFDGRTVTWEVIEGNHAVENARQAPLAEVLFGALRQIRWTRGTGGVITGNDEYHVEDRGPGGGADYVTSAYGPLGDAARVAALMRTGVAL